MHAVTEAQLPDFKRVALLTTAVDAPFITLPDLGINFGGRILKIRPELSMYRDLESMIDALEIEDINLISETNEIEGVTTEGGNLWYHPIPAEVVQLTVLYMATPPALLYSDDEIKYFPDHIQRLAICHGAAAICYEKIEDGLEEGKKVNTLHHLEMQGIGIQKLIEYKGKNRAHHITSTWGV